MALWIWTGKITFFKELQVKRSGEEVAGSSECRVLQWNIQKSFVIFVFSKYVTLKCNNSNECNNTRCHNSNQMKEKYFQRAFKPEHTQKTESWWSFWRTFTTWFPRERCTNPCSASQLLWHFKNQNWENQEARWNWRTWGKSGLINICFNSPGKQPLIV